MCDIEEIGGPHMDERSGGARQPPIGHITHTTDDIPSLKVDGQFLKANCVN